MDSSTKALFLSSRPIDKATLTATSQVASLPVSFLQAYQPERKYRANGNSFRVDIDLGAGNQLDCNCAVFIGHNGTATATGRIVGGNTVNDVNGTNAPLVDSGSQSAWPVPYGKHDSEDWPEESSLFLWDNEQSLRWWSFAWDDPDLSGLSEGGRLLIGRAFRPKFNISGNPLVGLVTAGVQQRSSFNRIYADSRGPNFRRIDVNINTINERDMWDSLFDLQRLMGVTKDFFFTANPAEQDYFHKWSGQFLFEDLSRFQANMQFDDYGRIWSTSFAILELV
jgi:hypothetical protein